MTWLSDALKTVESVVLLRSKVEQLTDELAKTNDKVERVLDAVIRVDRRLVRLETLEEARSGLGRPPRIES